MTKKRLFYTQRNYGLFQCSKPCCNETFDNEEAVRQMMDQQKDMRIPSTLLPVCPHCGKPLTMNLRANNNIFVEDEGWYLSAERYQVFLLTRENRQATYACINYGEAVCLEKIRSHSICIDEDIEDVLSRLTE